jgi:hypothetical protein
MSCQLLQVLLLPLLVQQRLRAKHRRLQGLLLQLQLCWSLHRCCCRQAWLLQQTRSDYHQMTAAAAAACP